MCAFRPATLIAALTVLHSMKNHQPASTATILNNGEVQDAMKPLDFAIGGLESNVGDFEDQNWREVVPEVQSAASNVRGTFDNLRRALQVPKS